MKREHQLVIKLSLSILFLGLIFWFIGPEKIIAVLLSARPEMLLLAILAYLAVNLIMSYRIQVVLRRIGNSLGIADVFRSNLAGMLASDFTPARAGYFFTAFSLSSRFRIPLERTMTAIFCPQLFDFFIKVLSAALLLLLMVQAFGIENWLINAFVILAVLGGITFAGLLVFYPPSLNLFSYMNHVPIASKGFAFLKNMHSHSGKVLDMKWEIISITLASWAFKALEWLFLAMAIGISITGGPASDYLFLVVFQAAITLIQFVPMPTLAGAGASEVGFAGILFLFGIPLELGITFAFLTRLTMVTIDVFALPVMMDYLRTHKAIPYRFQKS